MIPTTIHTLTDKKYRWVDVTYPGETELQYLEREFDLQALDIKDCLPPVQRPKLVAREAYLFAILVFPVFNPHTREVEEREVDFFIHQDYVITVHDNSFVELRNFFELLKLNAEVKDKFMTEPVRLVSQIIDELLDRCFPMLYHLSCDIDALRRRVLYAQDTATVYEILRLKNNIVAFRKSLQPHRDILKRLKGLLPTYLKLPDWDSSHLFDRLIDHTKEIWDHLETYGQAIDAVEDTHRTLISYRLNQIMKTLTIFSIIIFSLQLFSNIFIIPATSLPILGRPGDFWVILAIMALGTLTAIGIFKKKKWL